MYVLCRIENGQYRLSVSDTGIGIAPEHQKRIFEPFHQIDVRLGRKYEGTGLGLSIPNKIVEMMGGVIEVQSRLGQGSMFTVHFPLNSGEGA